MTGFLVAPPLSTPGMPSYSGGCRFLALCPKMLTTPCIVGLVIAQRLLLGHNAWHAPIVIDHLKLSVIFWAECLQSLPPPDLPWRRKTSSSMLSMSQISREIVLFTLTLALGWGVQSHGVLSAMQSWWWNSLPATLSRGVVSESETFISRSSHRAESVRQPLW